VAARDRSLSLFDRADRARRLGTRTALIYLRIRGARLLAQVLRPSDMEERWSAVHRRNAEEIYELAVELRGLILKGCQFLGSRSDVLPPEYTETLSRLQDRVPPHPFASVRRMVEHELGQPLEKVFREFAEQPLAAASLAQVHAARLADGQGVAVKVQYPEIERLVRSDLSNLRVLLRTLDLLERDFDPMPLVDELAETVPRELDFVNEGRNAERIAASLAHRTDLRIPQVLWKWTTRRVLTMERMEGIKITDRPALERAGVDLPRIAQALAEIFSEQILGQGFFHADPHPGNLLVRPEGPQLVLLDFGLAKQLPPGFRRGAGKLAAALVRGQSERLGRALQELGFRTRDGRPEGLQEIAELLLHAGQEIRARGRLDPELLARLRRELPERVRRNPIVRIPHHLVLVGRVLALLSGVNRSLGVRVDLLRAVAPHVLDRAPGA